MRTNACAKKGQNHIGTSGQYEKSRFKRLKRIKKKPPPDQLAAGFEYIQKITAMIGGFLCYARERESHGKKYINMKEVEVYGRFMAGIRRRFPVVYFSLLPAFVSIIYFLTFIGISVGDLKNRHAKHIKQSVMIHAAAFLAGFSVIFYILGFSASSVGLLFLQYHNLIRMLGGIFFVVMGLFLLGVFRPAFMMKERRFSIRKGKIGLLNSMLVGMIFAAGWTPCIGLYSERSHTQIFRTLILGAHS